MSDNADIAARLIRAHHKAALFTDDPQNRDEVCAILSVPGRIGVPAEVLRRTFDGYLKVSPDGTFRESDRYIQIGKHGAARPNPVHAAWLYAQMVRWRQAPLSPALLAEAKAVYRPDLYDAATGTKPQPVPGEPVDGVGAFTGPTFDENDLAKYLAAWR